MRNENGNYTKHENERKKKTLFFFFSFKYFSFHNKSIPAEIKDHAIEESPAFV